MTEPPPEARWPEPAPSGAEVDDPAARLALEEAGRRLFGDGFSVRRLRTTPSTQDVALAAVAAGARPGLVVLAGEQTAGRGRLGRRWLAAPGTALLASIVLPAAGGAWAPLAAGLAVLDGVGAWSTPARTRLRLKWPNDVLDDRGRKLAGVLLEARGVSGLLAVGIGLNLALAAEPDAPGVAATSLERLTGTAPPPDAVLAALLPALAARWEFLAAGATDALRSAWTAAAAGIGRPATVSTPAGGLAGIVEGVDSDGALLLRVDGGVRRVVAGDLAFPR